MNYAFLFAIMMVESSGNACVKHANPHIHGSTGMSAASLKAVGMTPEMVNCNTKNAYIAAWKNQKRFWKYSKGDPWKMAIIHHQGIGAFLKGRYNEVYMHRFAMHFDSSEVY